MAQIHAVVPGGTVIIAEPGKQEIVVQRVYDAPRELLFRAYTDPALVPRWWGPRRLSTVVDRLEAREGGRWRFVNRDAAGREYGFHGVYHQVASPSLLVFTFEFEGTPGRVSLDTVTFEGHGDRTVIRDQSVFQSVADRDAMYSADMAEGASETMERLAELAAAEWRG